MKPHLLYISLIAILLIIVTYQCERTTTLPTNTVVKAQIDTLENVIAILKTFEHPADSIRIITKWKYRTLHDTVPCEVKLVYCDSVIYRDSISISYKDSIILKYDSLVPKYKLLARVDSVTIESLQPRQTFYIGCDATTNGNIYPSLGFDTRKWVFMAGYDPFNKSVKAGAYFKIKAWKRR